MYVDFIILSAFLTFMTDLCLVGGFIRHSP